MTSRISRLAKQVQENPKDSFSKFALALELQKSGHIHKTLQLFENIANTDPEYVGVYYHLGAVYQELGENKKAIFIYNKGIEVAHTLRNEHARSELMAALATLKLELDL